MKTILYLCATLIALASCQKSGIYPAFAIDKTSTVDNITRERNGVSNASSFIGPVTDIDGNVYHTITVGKQTWMIENLKTTKYRDGTPIQNVTDAITWDQLHTGGYSDYNNDPQSVALYGRYYNWYAANNKHQIAPAGWHVPSIAEWETLVNYLGGAGVAGGKLKESGTTHWRTPNPASNTIGFNALPGGILFEIDPGRFCYFWSTNETSTYIAASCDLFFMSTIAYLPSDHFKYAGLSIRCIKDYTKGD